MWRWGILPVTVVAMSDPTPSWPPHWESLPYKTRRGPLHRGSLPAPYRPGWWHAALRITMAGEGSCLDTVVMYDASILSAGPLGCNLASGTLGTLAGELIHADPMLWGQAMAPVLTNPERPEAPYGWVAPAGPGATPRLSRWSPEDGRWLRLSKPEMWWAVWGRSSNQYATREQARALAHGQAWVRVLQATRNADAVMAASLATLRVFADDVGLDGQTPEGWVRLGMAVNNPTRARGLSGGWREMLDWCEALPVGDAWRTRAERMRRAVVVELAREAGESEMG